MEKEKNMDEIQELDERIERLNNREGILKKREKVFRIVAKTSFIAFVASFVLWVSAFAVNVKNKNDFIQNTNFDEFNEAYIETETENLAEKLYHKEITADEFIKSTELLKPISPSEYFDKHAPAEQKEEYSKFLKNENLMFAGFLASSISTGIVGFSVGKFGEINADIKHNRTMSDLNAALQKRTRLLAEKYEDEEIEIED